MSTTSEAPLLKDLEPVDIDLAMVSHKLANPDEGDGWSNERLAIADREYRRFLSLCRQYQDEAIVPCHLVDDMWHAHILDTRAYREDCDRVFGFFYDHYPYFGMRGAADEADLERAYERTLALCERHFGTPPVEVWGTMDGRRCRTECKPVKCK